MGTNYYVKYPGDNFCKHCNRGMEEVHIGKSSIGWTFNFDASHDKFRNIAECEVFMKNKSLYDEYGELVDHKDFWDLVNSKQRDPKNRIHYDDYPEDGYLDSEGYYFSKVEFS